MWRDLYHIPDVVAVDYADKQSKTDQEVLKFFQKTKSENDVDLSSSDYHTAYGVQAAMKLATLSKSGALAATLNADNYLSFAAELCAVYLSYEPATDPSLCIKDILGRVPTTTEDLRSPW